MTELREEREYLRGCPRDRRSINRHSQRTYEHNGIRYVLDRTTDALHPFFTLHRYTSQLWGGKMVEVEGKRYWGDGLSWAKAVRLAERAVSNEYRAMLQAVESGSMIGGGV